jgi:hypothetical protein
MKRVAKARQRIGQICRHDPRIQLLGWGLRWIWQVL